jgi:hypothetical protein
LGTKTKLELKLVVRNEIGIKSRNFFRSKIKSKNQALLEPFAVQTNLLQSDSQSMSSIIPSILNLECHLQQISVQHPATKTVALILLTELHKRFQHITDISNDKFNPTPSAACLLDPVFARVLLIPEQASLLHAAKLMVISMCGDTTVDNPSSTTNSQSASVIDSKGTSNLVKKFSFLANKLQAASSSSALSHFTSNNQETVQGQLNRYILELTESDLDTENAFEFWTTRMTVYKLIGPLALDLLSAPASQAFVERIFSLCGLLSAGRRNRMEKSLEMRSFLKLNHNLLL